MKKFLLLLMLVLPFMVSAKVNMLLDSVGIEKVGDKVFVLHKVDPKETLFSLSRRYGASVDEIKAANPGSENGISIGAIVKIPYNKKITIASVAVAPKMHTVKASETLFSVARLYAVSVDDLKKWNTLTTNELSIGQELIVSQGEDPAMVAAKVLSVVEVDKPKFRNLVGKGLSVLVNLQHFAYGIMEKTILKQLNNA